jgi:hypothetical protein
MIFGIEKHLGRITPGNHPPGTPMVEPRGRHGVFPVVPSWLSGQQSFPVFKNHPVPFIGIGSTPADPFQGIGQFPIFEELTALRCRKGLNKELAKLSLEKCGKENRNTQQDDFFKHVPSHSHEEVMLSIHQILAYELPDRASLGTTRN